MSQKLYSIDILLLLFCIGDMISTFAILDLDKKILIQEKIWIHGTKLQIFKWEITSSIPLLIQIQIYFHLLMVTIKCTWLLILYLARFPCYKYLHYNRECSFMFISWSYPAQYNCRIKLFHPAILKFWLLNYFVLYM